MKDNGKSAAFAKLLEYEKRSVRFSPGAGNSGGLSATRERAQQYRDAALDCLNGTAGGSAQDALVRLAHLSVDRDR